MKVNEHSAHLHTYTKMFHPGATSFTNWGSHDPCDAGHDYCIVGEVSCTQSADPVLTNVNSSSNSVPKIHNLQHSHIFAALWWIPGDPFVGLWGVGWEVCPAGHDNCRAIRASLNGGWLWEYSQNFVQAMEAHKINDKLHRHPTRWADATYGTSSTTFCTACVRTICPLEHTNCAVSSYTLETKNYVNSVTEITGYSNWGAG